MDPKPQQRMVSCISKRHTHTHTKNVYIYMEIQIAKGKSNKHQAPKNKKELKFLNKY